MKNVSDEQNRHVKFATTFQRAAQYNEGGRVTFIETPYIPPARHSLWDEVKRVFAILESAKRHDALLLNSSSGRIHPDVLAIILLGFKRSRPLIALHGDMWQPNRGFRALMDRLLIYLADRAVDRYIVLSSEEIEKFPLLWRVDKSKIRCCQYFFSLTEEELAAPAPPDGNHVFAGGNSLRDYEPLIEAARRMPKQRFVIASRLLEGRTDLPANIRAGQVSHAEFVNLMKSAAAVVVPLKKGLSRSSGQQTYLNAMALRKPVIVSEVFGVNDHIQNGESGLVVDGSSESFVKALTWALDSANTEAVARMVDRAQRAAQTQFTKERHVRKLIALMDELAAEQTHE
ncbi:MAG: glycosyltransferase family 4 protein [Anaerolineales bacterium]|nr:glycosyltransferase family 4 protein [Anaerolineales bacterium]